MSAVTGRSQLATDRSPAFWRAVAAAAGVDRDPARADRHGCGTHESSVTHAANIIR